MARNLSGSTVPRVGVDDVVAHVDCEHMPYHEHRHGAACCWVWDVECLVELCAPRGRIRCWERRRKGKKAHLAFHGKCALLDARGFDVDLHTVMSKHASLPRGALGLH